MFDSNEIEMLAQYTLPTREFFSFDLIPAHWPSGYSVRQWSGRPGFNPELCYTKDFKNGT